jgi:hypothetical protein
MGLRQIPNQRSGKGGYVAFLICGICVALNVLAYLPAQSFREAEATEFTVTLFLLLVFVIALLVAAISTIRNRRNDLLVLLLLLSVAFVAMTNYSRSWESKMRVVLQLSYAILVLTLGTIGMLLAQRRAK